MGQFALANDQLGIIQRLEFVTVIEFQIDAAASVVLRALVNHEITLSTPRPGFEEIEIRPSELIPTKTVADRKRVGLRIEVATRTAILHRYRELEA